MYSAANFRLQTKYHLFTFDHRYQKLLAVVTPTEKLTKGMEKTNLKGISAVFAGLIFLLCRTILNKVEY